MLSENEPLDVNGLKKRFNTIYLFWK